MALTNEELWEKLRLGHMSAIEDLYRFNYQVLYSFAYKICGDKELSKDCVQDLFVMLWEKRGQLNKVSKVRSYLLQSVWHSLVKSIKKQNRSINIDEKNHFNIEVVFPEENQLYQKQLKEENKDKLNNAISKLSARQKEIVFMQYYEGLTIEEIHQTTELKYLSIKNLTYRAMLSLRASFKLKKK